MLKAVTCVLKTKASVAWSLAVVSMASKWAASSGFVVHHVAYPDRKR